MATATLYALRQAWPDTHITVLVKRKLRPVLYGLDCCDRVLSRRKRLRSTQGSSKSRGRASLIRLGRRLSRGGFDAAVILPNSFKAAALAAVAGIPRRVGYERDGRGVLLTDRLIPRKHRGTFVPVSTLDAYLGIARYLGAENPSPAMRQRVKPESDALLCRRLTGAGHDISRVELMLINPGAPTAARRWSPRRMAHLCELMVERYGVAPVVTGTPNEREAVDQLLERATVPILDLPELGTDLHLLKAAIARSRMMVTNDTGPRHLAAALGTPLLTLFGPTVPQWSTIDFPDEQQVVADGISVAARDDPAFDGPASLDRLHADDVFEQACVLYERTRGRRIAGAGV
jgi:heptosyltransferase-2